MPGSQEARCLCLWRLAALNSVKPLLLQFAPDAQELFVEYNLKLEMQPDRAAMTLPRRWQHTSQSIGASCQSWPLFALADGCTRGVGFLKEVALEHAAQAAALCEYLEAHALRVYSCANRSELTLRAIRLGARLRKGWRNGDGFFSRCETFTKMIGRTSELPKRCDQQSGSSSMPDGCGPT